jgi:hypothetical protein
VVPCEALVVRRRAVTSAMFSSRSWEAVGPASVRVRGAGLATS